ncbi:hypothetical protein ACHAWF_016370 [Thalassiosira exigua]
MLFFVLVSTLIGAVMAEPSDLGKLYQLYHKLGDDSSLAPRGAVRIAPDENGGIGATFLPHDSAQLDTVAFDAMVQSGALYTLVVLEEGGVSPGVSSYPPKHAKYVSSSVPGCSLRRSNLREEIGLTIGPTGKLLSVFYRPLLSSLAPKTCQKLMPLSDKPEAIYGRRGDNEGGSSTMPFKTTVSFDSHKPMMAVPTVLPQQRPPPGLKWYRRNTKNNPNPMLGGSNVNPEGGGIPGVDDEPPSGFKSSFLYRYWYIIVPVAMMGLFGGVDEEEVAKQQQQAGLSQGATASGAGAVAAGGVAQARQRRGKRD